MHLFDAKVFHPSSASKNTVVSTSVESRGVDQCLSGPGTIFFFGFVPSAVAFPCSTLNVAAFSFNGVGRCGILFLSAYAEKGEAVYAWDAGLACFPRGVEGAPKVGAGCEDSRLMVRGCIASFAPLVAEETKVGIRVVLEEMNCEGIPETGVQGGRRLELRGCSGGVQSGKSRPALRSSGFGDVVRSFLYPGRMNGFPSLDFLSSLLCWAGTAVVRVGLGAGGRVGRPREVERLSSAFIRRGVPGRRG